MNMATKPLVPVEEYLRMSFEGPDPEYLDGELLERNLGESDHSNVQMALSSYLYTRRKQLGIRVLPEQRVQVNHGVGGVPLLSEHGHPIAAILTEQLATARRNLKRV